MTKLDVRKRDKGTEYLLVWVPVGKEVLEQNYIDTIDFKIISPEELKKLQSQKRS